MCYKVSENSSCIIVTTNDTINLLKKIYACCVKERDRLNMNSSPSNSEDYRYFQFKKLTSPRQYFKFIIILILIIFQKSLSFASQHVMHCIMHIINNNTHNKNIQYKNINVLGIEPRLNSFYLLARPKH